MTTAEALVVTGLGMSVTFVGLVLCIGFIQLFNRLARRLAPGEAAASAAAPVATEPAVASPATPAGEPVPAPVLAVIAAVLAVERTLYLGPIDARLTLRRTPPTPGDLPS